MTDAHSDSVTFASLGLVDEVMAGIKQAGFVNCTPIQAQTLPIALAGRDVAGQAQTGTGKTAAFLVAIYQSLLTRPAAPNRQQHLDPRADRRPDARAGGADPPRRADARRAHRPQAHGGVRRHRLREAAPGARRRLRRADRHARHGSSTTSSSTCSTCATRRCWCSMRPTACSTWASSPTSATCCAACRTRSGASRCCSPPRCRTGCWNSPTST